jgi:hypothetical protein
VSESQQEMIIPQLQLQIKELVGEKLTPKSIALARQTIGGDVLDTERDAHLNTLDRLIPVTNEVFC